ncbi:MAG: polysaccharide lyase [Verrucomicrobiota bacterium]
MRGVPLAGRFWGTVALVACGLGFPVLSRGAAAERHLTAKQVFESKEVVIFHDDFRSGGLEKWNLSEDDRYRLGRADPERLRVQGAPGLAGDRKAVRFSVPRAADSFRAELSLPSEQGFNERWYGESLLVPEDWVFDAAKGHDIVMQWHAVPGNGRATYPNLAISIQDSHWFIQQNFGATERKATRVKRKLDEPVRRGAWLAWVVHAKWSPRDDGLIEIWLDGKRVVEIKGPNVYTTIGVEYTPYLKTGIYHPAWHLDVPAKRAAFAQEVPTVTSKVVWVAEVRIGSAQATYADVVPRLK